MQTYEVGIKTRRPRFIAADKMEVDSRGALVFKNKIKDKYLIILIVNAQK